VLAQDQSLLHVYYDDALIFQSYTGGCETDLKYVWLHRISCSVRISNSLAKISDNRSVLVDQDSPQKMALYIESRVSTPQGHLECRISDPSKGEEHQMPTWLSYLTSPHNPRLEPGPTGTSRLRPTLHQDFIDKHAKKELGEQSSWETV
jgi:hypothetical protein